MIAMRVIMIARVIFGLRRYVHLPLIVKGYSVNRLPVFLSPLSPLPSPPPRGGRGRWGWGYSLREQHHLPLPFPALPLMARCTGRATGTPEGKVGVGLFATVSTPWFPMARRSCRRVSTQNSV